MDVPSKKLIMKDIELQVKVPSDEKNLLSIPALSNGLSGEEGRSNAPVCASRPSSSYKSSPKQKSTDNLSDLVGGIRFLIPGRMAFVAVHPDRLPVLKKMTESMHIACVSSELHRQYTPFCADFGPVNLAIVYRFCKAMSTKVTKTTKNGDVLLYCIEPTFQSLANASFLLAAFLLLECNYSPDSAAAPFTGPSAPFPLVPFRDATFLEPDYALLLIDCLRGLRQATTLGWFSLSTFDLASYLKLEHPCSGDLHVICPRFVAFKGPLRADSSRRQQGEMAFPPAHYIPALLGLGVTCVIRLNDPDTYNADEFTRAGIQHVDLYFDDCTVPSDDVIRRFLDAVDASAADFDQSYDFDQPSGRDYNQSAATTPNGINLPAGSSSPARARELRPATAGGGGGGGAVAVHCRAGLGRTGTLIALWLMKHAGFSADGAIGWLRVVRPGSVIGPQQHFLRHFESCRGWLGNTPVDLFPPHQPRSSHSTVPAVVATPAAPAAAECAARGPPRRRWSNETLPLPPSPPPPSLTHFIPRAPSADRGGAGGRAEEGRALEGTAGDAGAGAAAERARQVTEALARRDLRRSSSDPQGFPIALTAQLQPNSPSLARTPSGGGGGGGGGAEGRPMRVSLRSSQPRGEDLSLLHGVTRTESAPAAGAAAGAKAGACAAEGGDSAPPAAAAAAPYLTAPWGRGRVGGRIVAAAHRAAVSAAAAMAGAVRPPTSEGGDGGAAAAPEVQVAPRGLRTGPRPTGAIRVAVSGRPSGGLPAFPSPVPARPAGGARALAVDAAAGRPPATPPGAGGGGREDELPDAGGSCSRRALAGGGSGVGAALEEGVGIERGRSMVRRRLQQAKSSAAWEAEQTVSA